MFTEIKDKWDTILQIIKTEYEMTDVSFKTWILPLKPHSLNDDVLTIVVPGEQRGLSYIEKKYINHFKVTVSEVLEHEIDIKFISADNINSSDVNTVKQDYDSKKKELDYSSTGINPKYTFDTFVVGDNNRFAHSGALAVAESPGETSYNPLFLYGGVGLGKTHLMHSIGNFILQNNPSLKVMYVTSEKFTIELIESIKNDKNTSNRFFREKYRNVDVLLIDDIQFIIGKDGTQEEFFHTFNALRESNKQIIISSDRPPKDFETLEARLRSRFEWGLLVDITPPNYETRMAILHKKAELEGYNIDNEIYNYIATNVKSNIRELEGSLTKLVAYSKLTHSEINISFAEDVLKDIISPNAQRKVTPELIIQVVAEHYGITAADISSQRRNNEIAFPRQVAMYLCRYMTDVPLEAIGSYMGKRHHSTIKYGVDTILEEMKTNESLKATIDVIMKKINPN